MKSISSFKGFFYINGFSSHLWLLPLLTAAQAMEEATLAATESQVAEAREGAPESHEPLSSKNGLDKNDVRMTVVPTTTSAPTSPASSLPSTASKSQDEVFQLKV